MLEFAGHVSIEIIINMGDILLGSSVAGGHGIPIVPLTPVDVCQIGESRTLHDGWLFNHQFLPILLVVAYVSLGLINQSAGGSTHVPASGVLIGVDRPSLG